MQKEVINHLNAVFLDGFLPSARGMIKKQMKSSRLQSSRMLLISNLTTLKTS